MYFVNCHLTNRAFLLKICLPYQDVDVIIQLFCLYILINDLIYRPSEVAKVLKSLNVNKVWDQMGFPRRCSKNVTWN